MTELSEAQQRWVHHLAGCSQCKDAALSIIGPPPVVPLRRCTSGEILRNVYLALVEERRSRLARKADEG